MYSDCTVHRRTAEEVEAGFPRINETQGWYRGDMMVFRRTVLIREIACTCSNPGLVLAGCRYRGHWQQRTPWGQEEYTMKDLECSAKGLGLWPIDKREQINRGSKFFPHYNEHRPSFFVLFHYYNGKWTILLLYLICKYVFSTEWTKIVSSFFERSTREFENKNCGFSREAKEL